MIEVLPKSLLKYLLYAGYDTDPAKAMAIPRRRSAASASNPDDGLIQADTMSQRAPYQYPLI